MKLSEDNDGQQGASYDDQWPAARTRLYTGGSGGTADQDNDDQTGLVIGAGLETKLSEHVSIGMEGLYYFFDDSKVDFYSDGDKVESIDTNNDLIVARARLTFHFNNAGP